MFRISSLGCRGDYSWTVRASAWHRGAFLVRRYGVDGALYVLDARAEQALLSGHVDIACRWRELMTAIHAMSEEERQADEGSH